MTTYKTPDEAREAWFRCLDDVQALVLLAVWISLTTTVDQIQEAYQYAADNDGLERVALAKWEELALAEANAAQDYDQAEAVYLAAPEGGQAEKAALAAMIRRSLEVSQAAMTYQCAADCAAGNSDEEEGGPDHSFDELAAAALSRWEELSLVAAQEATTVEEAEAALEGAPPDSLAEIVAKAKAEAFADP
ncbi:MAG: hypothetical protein PHT12_06180 [Patescibacteria group bacterium]|nr:hypothetical protein [Patescibacteria group bacterium]